MDNIANLTGKPRLLKQANLTLIRRVIIEKGTATRAEITEKTKISSTTVRSLLCEMLDNGEIESVGHDKSSGGRKAERYRFRPDCYYSAAICISDDEAHALLVNVYGEIVESKKIEVEKNNYEPAVYSCVDEMLSKWEIKSIGLGIPGVVEGDKYWKKYEGDGKLYRYDIGSHLAEKYALPVILENDINATAIGFGRCYQKQYPDVNPEYTNMVYIHFNKGCISAGIIAGGRIIRGFGNFAGELGLIPRENGEFLDTCLGEAYGTPRYTELIIETLTWICGILNPQYIVLGGPDFPEDCLGPINDGLYSLLPDGMFVEILYSPHVWSDYLSGMAYLTAGKMFDEIQLRKG